MVVVEETLEMWWRWIKTIEMWWWWWWWYNFAIHAAVSKETECRVDVRLVWGRCDGGKIKLKKDLVCLRPH